MDGKLRATAEAWLRDDPDPGTVSELGELMAKDDVKELTDRFAARLEFGTAGLRGVLGAGPNRMNRKVVMETTAGLARYLLAHAPGAPSKGVVIGYDGRRGSRVFARDTAAVLAGHGIPALLFPVLAPTPLVAFATPHLGCVAGVMVTASHNPPEYNGYKVYWQNGAQIIPPHDGGIAKAIEAVGPCRELPYLAEADARARELWSDVPQSCTDAYFAAVKKLSRSSAGREGLQIVYSAMHGVGGDYAKRALAEAGFPAANVHVVPEQQEPDGAFPTVRFPNPEEPGALDLALALATKVNADVVLANDPDADRLAVAARRPEGGYQLLSGNQIGAIFGGYLLRTKPDGAKKRLAITTIVSSPMLGVMCRELGVAYDEVLTGFKWIGNRAMVLQGKDPEVAFQFGYEEAIGFSVGTVARDKDGVGAAAIFAELAAEAKARGSSVLGELEALYRTFGVFGSRQISVTMKGADGLSKISRIMEHFRANPPAALGGAKVVRRRDHKRCVIVQDGVESKLDLPPSNVLAYELEGDGRLILRPSGTEPKIKYYFDLRELVRSGEPIAEADARANARIARIADDFVKLADAVA